MVAGEAESTQLGGVLSMAFSGVDWSPDYGTAAALESGE